MHSRPKVYFENLDALRFLCFVAVFLFHSFHTTNTEISSHPVYQLFKFRIFGNGNLGVNFFFVLSGYLITYLLLQERLLRGRIDVLRFWVRRILRIWPLFFVCVLAGFYLFPYIKSWFGDQPNESAHLLSYLTFTNNFDYIKYGTDASVLSVLWSIAVEEQFYLLWPIVVALTPRGSHWAIFSLILLGTLVFRALVDDLRILEYHTLSCIGDMTIGAFGALWVVEYGGTISIGRWKKNLLRVCYALVLIVFLFRKELFYNFYILRVTERMIIAGLFLIVILAECFGPGSKAGLGRFKSISRLGGMTYGFYCLHFWGILVATHLTEWLGYNRELWQVLILDTMLAFVITLLIGYLSYRWFETPFLKLKERFSWIDTLKQR